MPILYYKENINDKKYVKNGIEHVLSISCTKFISSLIPCYLCEEVKFKDNIAETDWELFLHFGKNCSNGRVVKQSVGKRILCWFYDDIKEDLVNREELVKLRDIKNLPEDLWLYQPEEHDKFEIIKGQKWLFRQDHEPWKGIWKDKNIRVDFMVCCKMYEYINKKFFVEKLRYPLSHYVGEFSQDRFNADWSSFRKFAIEEIEKM